MINTESDLSLFLFIFQNKFIFLFLYITISMRPHLQYIILSLSLLLCVNISAQELRCGAERMESYLPDLEGKKVGVVVNHSSRVGESHLLDTLLSLGVDLRKIYAPEHGFRGTADAGEYIVDQKDVKSGLPIISLYGKNKRPSAEQLAQIDIIIFDIQDVGARFYTYISTLYYVMQSCAQNGVEIMVLDRPNPNDYIDGPILKSEHRSFVGALPIPILHGLTMCELARMINGEGWIGERKVELSVVPMEGWQHQQPYSLPIKPSPNLPNDQAIALYPSLCFFEATDVSVGRGTLSPFEIIGMPNPKFGTYTFTPTPTVGSDKNPLQNGKLCYGLDLRQVTPPEGLSLSYFIDFMKLSGAGAAFITRPEFFDLLSGDSSLREMLIQGCEEAEIRASWQSELDTYKKMRSKYIIYNEK